MHFEYADYLDRLKYISKEQDAKEVETLASLGFSRLYGSSQWEKITSTDDDGLVSVYAGHALLCSFYLCTLLLDDVLDVQITVYSCLSDCQAALVHHVKQTINKQTQDVQGAVTVAFDIQPDIQLTAAKGKTLSEVLQNKLKEQYQDQ